MDEIYVKVKKENLKLTKNKKNCRGDIMHVSERHLVYMYTIRLDCFFLINQVGFWYFFCSILKQF